MRESKFTKEQKVNILKEIKESNLTLKKVCDKHGISISTVYTWKREMENEQWEPKLVEETDSTEKLKRLYISLSQHNYELSKLLIK